MSTIPCSARPRPSLEKAERARWLEADACDLPFHDRKFDVVVCQFGTMFVPDKALAAREAYRVLKRDGVNRSYRQDRQGDAGERCRKRLSRGGPCGGGDCEAGPFIAP
ncbi:MAG: hypothetical protein DME40_04000 [Verrucomicrobia bacterium]|nr:MAG: hypothetical protein DME40_04000 [Verrucomicrobiota bacterium]